MIEKPKCKKCGNNLRTVPFGHPGKGDPYLGSCPCADAPEGSTLVVGVHGMVIGWTSGRQKRFPGPRPASVAEHYTAMAAFPIINPPLPAQTSGASWEDDHIVISIASGDLVVEYASDHTRPAAHVEHVMAFGPHAHPDDARGSVRRIRVRLSDLERQYSDARILRGAPADSGAYARGVAAAREAIAAAKYDAERSHAEWSVRTVVVPEDSGK